MDQFHSKRLAILLFFLMEVRLGARVVVDYLQMREIMKYVSDAENKRCKTWQEYVDEPLALLAVSIVRHAMITRAPRLAKSLAVSLPIPLLAPVIRTVFPSIRIYKRIRELLDWTFIRNFY